MTDQSRTARQRHPAAGEAPVGLRNRLNDANEEAGDDVRPARVDLEELHEAARERDRPEPVKKRSRRRR